MKNILLLTDFSENAQNAIDYALDFFKGSAHNFFLLNVQKVSNYTTGDLMSSTPGTSIYDSVIKNPKARVKEMVASMEKNIHMKPILLMAFVTMILFQAPLTKLLRIRKLI